MQLSVWRMCIIALVLILIHTMFIKGRLKFDRKKDIIKKMWNGNDYHIWINKENIGKTYIRRIIICHLLIRK